MPIRRGKEYLESLRDGRHLWLMGQRVEDVTTHAALAGCAHSVAAVYDLQHDPAHQDLLTMPSPTTSQPVTPLSRAPSAAALAVHPSCLCRHRGPARWRDARQGRRRQRQGGTPGAAGGGKGRVNFLYVDKV